MSLLNNRRALISIAVLIVGAGVVLFGVQNCGRAGDFKAASQPSTGGPNTPEVMTLDDGYVQIERLGRPAINEGLLFSNDFLNAFNSIPPTLDLATDNPTVLKVLQQASAALDLFDTLDGNPNSLRDGFESQVVAGFLPDVMRINTNDFDGVNSIGYASDFVLVGDPAKGNLMLTGGRKIKDDVADITLTYLVAGLPAIQAALGGAGFAIQDGVSYAGATGNPAQGHSPLHKQAADGSAEFPFLAMPR